MTEMNLMPLGDQVQKFRGHLVDNYEMPKILNNYIAISY